MFIPCAASVSRPQILLEDSAYLWHISALVGNQILPCSFRQRYLLLLSVFDTSSLVLDICTLPAGSDPLLLSISDCPLRNPDQSDFKVSDRSYYGKFRSIDLVLKIARGRQTLLIYFFFTDSNFDRFASGMFGMFGIILKTSNPLSNKLISPKSVPELLC